MERSHTFFADFIMLIHFAWVLFNLSGFFLVLKFPKLKAVHLSTLSITALIMLTGNICPLTLLEQHLKENATPSSAYRTSFLSHTIGKVLYISVQPSTITAITTLLLFIAIWSYIVYPWIKKNKEE